MKRGIALGALAALIVAGAATAADKEQLSAWWRSYEEAPFAKTPDGRKLRVFCQGQGEPAVVLESGLGAGAWGWRTVQPDITSAARVCSYDRAGYGLSDEAKDPRDLDSLAADLAVAVKAAGRGKPVVLVGHSLGGPIVRQFAYRHPRLIAGLVLIDPSADHQVDRFTATVPSFRAINAAGQEPSQKCIAALAKGPIPFGTPDYGACVGPAPPDMPAELRHFHVDYGQSAIHHRAILAEFSGAWSEASGKEADEARKPLGDVPMIVLTAGKPSSAPGFSDADAARFTALWRQMHWEMLSLSTDSRRRFVEGAGHAIQIDKPQAVIQAVGEVIAEARGRSRNGAR